MFEWKVEEMRLMNDQTTNRKRFSFEDSVSREDKIAFVDSMENGKLTRLLNVIEKFKAEKDTLPKDVINNVKTVSLIAWVKRQNATDLIDTEFNYGKYRVFGLDRNIYTNNRSSSDTYDDLVNEVFHRTLLDCRHKEYRYFNDTDPYCVAKTKLRKKLDQYRTAFGLHLILSSNGEISITPNEDSFEPKRPITLEEINILLNKYDELDAFVEKLSSDVNIEF